MSGSEPPPVDRRSAVSVVHRSQCRLAPGRVREGRVADRGIASGRRLTRPTTAIRSARRRQCAIRSRSQGQGPTRPTRAPRMCGRCLKHRWHPAAPQRPALMAAGPRGVASRVTTVRHGSGAPAVERSGSSKRRSSQPRDASRPGRPERRDVDVDAPTDRGSIQDGGGAAIAHPRTVWTVQVKRRERYGKITLPSPDTPSSRSR